MMDALLLARMQFAASITFHILFPTISIGMGWLLLYFRLRWLYSAPRSPQTASLSASVSAVAQRLLAGGRTPPVRDRIPCTAVCARLNS